MVQTNHVLFPLFFLCKAKLSFSCFVSKNRLPFSHSESSYPSLAGKGVRRIFAIRFATCLIRLNLEARAVILRFFQYAFFCQNCQSSERKIQNFVRTCKTFPQSGACSLRKCFFRYAPGSNSILRDRKLQRNFLPRKKSATETLSENCG